MLAIVCPGQGSQTPGMLTDWLELPGAGWLSDRLDAYGRAAGVDLRAHGTASDADTIRDTAVAQPLIVAASLLAAEALGLLPGGASGTSGAPAGSDAAPVPVPAVVAGHSVGEFAAAAVAGALAPQDALGLVAVRGAAMARSAAARPSGMSAVLGGEPDAVAARLDELGLTAANVNGGGQVVAAGALDALAALAAEPPARARVVALQVAGAFHTEFMAPAVAELADAVARVPVAERPHPARTLLSNADGAAVATGEDLLRRLVVQVSSPVRWDLCQRRLADLGVTGLLELAPGGVLTGLARRTLPGVETVAVKSPADLDAARDLVARHTAAAAAPDPSEETPA